MDAHTARQALVAGCESAALVLAQQLSLGDATRAARSWPFDPAATVLRMPITEQPGASLLLAVNTEVADRLFGDAGATAEAFVGAVRALAGVLGVGLSGGAIEVAGPDEAEPDVVIEILDDLRVTALVGVTLDISVDEEPEPAAQPWTPGVLQGRGSMAGVLGATPLTVLNDVMMTVTAELGRTTMPIRDLLNLSPGMVVEIDRIAGAPIDLLVNGRRIAVGEVVVIDEEFGVRITEIAPPDELLR